MCEAHRLRQVSDECRNLTAPESFHVPDRKTKSGIEAHFAGLESQRQRCDAAADEKQRKISNGALLDVEREPARGTVDPYLGDSVENLTDATLNPWKTYGAGRRSSVSGHRAAKPKPVRGRPFDTKEAEPREVQVPTRTTSITKGQLDKYKRETGRNASDVLMLFSDVLAASANGSSSAKMALMIIESYARKSHVGELDRESRKLLSVMLKGLPNEAA